MDKTFGTPYKEEPWFNIDNNGNLYFGGSTNGDFQNEISTVIRGNNIYEIVDGPSWIEAKLMQIN